MATLEPSLAGLSQQQRHQLDLFAEVLRAQNRRHNLVSAGDIEALYPRHFADCLAAVPVVESGDTVRAGGRLVDIGSGAGLPAVVLAIALPTWQVASIEATGKKGRFQEEAVRAIGLGNVTIVHGRAEELGRQAAYREGFDVAVARAVAELRVLVEIAMPLLRVGGRLVAFKGPDPAQEIAEAAGTLEGLGARLVRTVPYRLAGLAPQPPEFHLVIVEKTAPTDDTYPRPWQRITKSPPA